MKERLRRVHWERQPRRDGPKVYSGEKKKFRGHCKKTMYSNDYLY